MVVHSFIIALQLYTYYQVVAFYPHLNDLAFLTTLASFTAGSKGLWATWHRQFNALLPPIVGRDTYFEGFALGLVQDLVSVIVLVLLECAEAR